MKHLDDLSEALNTEIKDWLNPANPHDQACIAKACIALYNHGGGKLILGFDDKTLKPTTYHFLKSVREIYHLDNLCPCIAKFAKPLFEVRVKFEKKNEQEHPIIEVPSGVCAPVVIKSTDKEKKVFSRQNMVITRTLANQTFSSSEPQTPEDWDNLIQTCFDNREADVGRFFRRHLIPIQREMGSLDGRSPAVQVLDESKKSFFNRLDTWSKKFKFDKPQIYGLREVAFWIDGKIQSINCFLDKMLVVAQPRLSPRPPFIDGRRFHNKSNHPYTTKDGWYEALVFEKSETRSPGEYELDFWRMHPKGKFYHACVYDDDRRPAKRKPGQGIEFNLLIRRITEIIAVALAFAKSFGCVEDATSLHFAFRFTGLEGRKLCSWYERRRSLWNIERTAIDNPEVIEIKIPSDLPPTRIWEIVKQVVQPVFNMFAGSGFGDSVLKEIANNTLRGYW